MTLPSWLSTFLRSKLFKGIVALIAAALTAWATTGCAALLSHVQGPRDVLDCRVDVLQEHVGDQAEDLVREIEGNEAFNIGRYLLRQGLKLNEIEALGEAYQACSPELDVLPVEPTPEPALQTLLY